MTTYRCAAVSNRFKSLFTVTVLSMMISACSSSGSDDNAGPIIPTENDNMQFTDNDNMQVTDNDNMQVIDNDNMQIIDNDNMQIIDNDNMQVIDNDNMQVIDNDNMQVIDNITTLINVPRSDGWVCTLGDGTFGAYSFFADSTGIFEYLTPNDDGTFAIGETDPFTYVTTSANSVQILYEFVDGTSIMETVTGIAFADASAFTALSDIEGAVSCSRRDFIPATTDTNVDALSLSTPATSTYF